MSRSSSPSAECPTPTKRWCPYGLLLLFACVGCNYRARPDRPDFSPKQSAADALKAYDVNSDGGLSETEVAGSPGVVAAFPRIDVDGDKQLSPDEIANRVRYYRKAGVAVVNGSTQVFYRGKPLDGATITFEPEAFLGSEFQPCSGTTDEYGQTYLSREAAEFPGLYLGFYRVHISKVVKGKEMVPAKYNTESTLGFEAADDIPDVKNVIRFDLN